MSLSPKKSLLLENFLDVKDDEGFDVLRECSFNTSDCNSLDFVMPTQDVASQILPQKNLTASYSKGEEDEPSSELLFESPNREYGCLENFLKKLQHRYSNEKRKNSQAMSSPRQSPRRSGKRPLTSPGCSRTSKFRRNILLNRSPCVLPSTSSSSVPRYLPSSLSESDCKDEEKVVQHLKYSYDTCIESQKDLLQVAQSILGDALVFLRSKPDPVDKIHVHEYLEGHHICLSMKDIQGKYNGMNDPESVAKKIKEYQLQTILYLEIEVEFPCSSPSKCIGNVTSLLRGLSFVAGPGELLKFLQEHVKEQYGQTLRNILMEIGEELNVPLIPEPFSPSSPSDIVSPGGVSRSSASPCSSVIAAVSSSSAASQLGEESRRKSFVRHSSFSGNFQSKQIMVPKELLRKEKVPKPKTEIKLVRRSPRLSMRQMTRELVNQKKLPTNPPSKKSVRRNLFNAEGTNKSPRKKTPSREPSVKRRLFRSKSHQSIKRTIVPETPSPKQGKSALRRKQARVQMKLGKKDTVQEIAESPVTSRNAIARMQHSNGDTARNYSHIEKKCHT